MNGFRLIVALLPLVFSGLTGCSTIMQVTPLPEGFAVREIAKADAGTPLAINPSGGFAAVSKGTIQVHDTGGAVRKIAEGTPSALSFSPKGDLLAAALPAGKSSTLLLFDRQGKVVAETVIAEEITSLAWRSQSQLLATALQITKFAFGSQLKSVLYLWDGTTPPLATTLSEVTIRPGLAKLPEETLKGTFFLAVSPYRDEIAYGSLKDPPVYTPYLRVMVRHLESGAVKELGKISVGQAGAVYAPDGESLLVGDSRSLTRRLSIPQGREMDAWPSPGSYPALSPSGSYLFLDGRVYQDGRAILSFPSRARAAFLPDGSGLLVSYDGRIYQVSGLQDRAAAVLPADLDRLLELRRQRSLDLVTEKEYRAQKQQLLAP